MRAGALRIDEGMSFEKIGKKLGRPPSSVSAMLGTDDENPRRPRRDLTKAELASKVRLGAARRMGRAVGCGWEQSVRIRSPAKRAQASAMCESNTC